MKTISGMLYFFCLSALVILGGCGGGGGDGGTPATPATTAAVKLSTQGTLPTGSQLAGIAVTIQLPAGVTVATDTSGAVASGVVTVTGVAASGISALGPVIYTPATASTPGTLEFTLAASNFGTGEFATVNFKLASGASAPVAANVTIVPADQSLHPVTGLSVALSVQLS